MKVHFFERQLVTNRISIEKVFSIVKEEISKKDLDVLTYVNPYPLKQFFKSLWFFRKHQGDINHITGDIHWACLLLDRNKTILTIHDIVGIRNYHSKWKRNLYLLVWLYVPLWKLKYITVISEKTKREILEFCPSAHEKITVIGNPLTIKIQPRSFIKKEPKDINLLIIGTRENKNIDRILEATKDLPCQIIIVGDLNDVQKEKVKSSKGSILIKSFLTDDQLEDLYKSSDILCFPSLYEGFGMPIIEAQAVGCAVITSNMEPMTSVAGDGAIFVDAWTTADIAEKILQLVQNDELRKILVEKGYENAKNYLPEKIAQQYSELYQKIKAM